MQRPRRRRVALWIAVAILAAAWLNRRLERRPDPGPTGARPAARPAVNPIEALLAPSGPASPRQEGIAAAILVDASGSMADSVAGEGAAPATKIAIARRTVSTALGRFEAFAREHPDRTVRVGVYEFSSREGRPPCRVVVPLGAPDRAAAEKALARIVPKGGTPIGDAMIQAKRDLDATGLARLHLLVVTDGENNRGYTPGSVASALARQPEAMRASLYFVAFDIAAERFKAVREAGGLVLAAASEADLNQTFDYLLTGKILAEQPAVPER